MKKLNLKVVACLMMGTLLYSSCIGSFSLFNSYAKWQCNMTGNKFINAIVGFILMPIVGSVCLFVDSVVLNTIEFWTGSNPMAAGQVKTVMGQDGRYYAIKTLKNGYEVKDANGEKTLFIHDAKTDSWSMTQNGVTKELIRFNANGTIQATLQNGETLTVSNDEAGLMQVREAVYNENCYALR